MVLNANICFFGNSSWNGFHQRDIHFAETLERKGYIIFSSMNLDR